MAKAKAKAGRVSMSDLRAMINIRFILEPQPEEAYKKTLALNF